MTTSDIRQHVTASVMDAIANELADRTILASGLFLEEPTLTRVGSGYGESATFTAFGAYVRNPVQVRVTVEVL